MPKEIVTDLLDMFPDKVVLERRGATDGFGEESGWAVIDSAVKARIADKTMNVRNSTNQVVASKQHVILAGVFELTELDRVTLPARFSVRQPQIVAVETTTDENGPHHETVYFS